MSGRYRSSPGLRIATSWAAPRMTARQCCPLKGGRQHCRAKDVIQCFRSRALLRWNRGNHSNPGPLGCLGWPRFSASDSDPASIAVAQTRPCRRCSNPGPGLARDRCFCSDRYCGSRFCCCRCRCPRFRCLSCSGSRRPPRPSPRPRRLRMKPTAPGKHSMGTTDNRLQGDRTARR